jgi:transcriptional regulator with XRE-family HTH domain
MADKITLEGVACGASIVFLRKLGGMSRTQLRDRCGWKATDSALGKYETGARIPGENKLETLAAALGVPGSLLHDLQRALLSYVRMHPLELDLLLRKSGLQIEAGDVKEPSPTYEVGPLDQATERRWRTLAREKGALQQREVLLLLDTLLRAMTPAGDPSGAD